MTRSPDYLKRRMLGAMKDGADIAYDLEAEEDVRLPPEYVGRMGLALFQMRMQMALSDFDGFELPEETHRGTH